MQRYQRVSYGIRCQIYACLNTNISVSRVAKTVKKHRSTIYRELKRNSVKGFYDIAFAQSNADKNFARCRRRRRFQNTSLRRSVEKCLRKDWSPQQVAHRVFIECGYEISHQTIYREIRNVRIDLERFLRRYGKRRGRGRRRRFERKLPAWMKSIHERPKNIGKRKHLGHWERDTMFTKERSTAIVCLERMSRYVKLEKVKEPYTKHLTRQTKAMLRSKDLKLLSLTNDNGNEFMDGYRFDIPVYYCDPHSPHQKGSVENAIGLLRQYVPRSFDLTKVSRRKLNQIANKLNHRPRKCLDYRTPHEVMYGKHVALVT